MQTVSRHSLLFLAFLVMCLVALDKASAQDRAIGATDSLVPEKPHCIIQIDSVRKGEDESRVLDIECYDSFSDAIYAASQGEIALPKDASVKELTSEISQREQSQYILGTMYEHSNRGGSSFTWWTSNSAMCSGGRYYYVSSIPASAGSWWNDRVSSAWTLGNCDAWYFEHTNYGGAALKVTSYVGHFGAMNDRASSIQWHANGKKIY